MTETCDICTAQPDPDFPDFDTWYTENKDEQHEFWDMMVSLGEQYYDHGGNPISYAKWDWARIRDPGYRTLKHWHRGDGFVSTVLLGKDHALFNGPLMIFETMVFDVDGWRNAYERYGSATAAMRGHDMIVAAIESGQTCEEWYRRD